MLYTPPDYRAHDSFIRPAMAKSQLWRVFVMIAWFELAFMLGPRVIAALLPDTAATVFIAGITPIGTLSQFASFGLIAWLFIAMMQLVHERGFSSLIGPPRMTLRDTIRVMRAVGVILIIIEIAPQWESFAEIAEIRNLWHWAAFIPLGMVALLIQVGTEEIYFRGYLQQQFACLSSSPWVWMGFPSLFFGAAHYFNGLGPADSILWAVWASLLGLACADLTARTGNIGAAVGLHCANNMLALFIYGIADWPGSGLALFLFPYFDPLTFDYGLQTLVKPEIFVPFSINIIMVWIMWMAARVAIRR